MQDNFRSMPCDIEAEMTLIGSMFIDSAGAENILQQLEIDDFYDKKHTTIISAMKMLYEEQKPIDVVTVVSKMTDLNKLIDAGGMEYLLQLTQSVPTIAHKDYYIKMLKEKSKLRKLINVSYKTAEEAMIVTDNIDDFIDKAESELLSITRNYDNHEAKSIHTAVERVTEKLLKLKSNQDITGLSTGYSQLDKMTLGFQDGELIILAARPGIGKTAFALNVASNISAKNNMRCLFFSLEMSDEQLAQRLISIVGQIASKPLRNGDSIKYATERYYAAAEKVSKSNIYIDDNSATTINEIISTARKLNNEKKLDLIIIDYLQLISSFSRGDRQQLISEISRKLKILARELEVPILCLSQLSRKVEERQDKRPILSDLRDSGAIEQDADIVMFLYRENYYNYESETDMDITEVIVAKNRSGATGSIKVAFEKQFGRFSNITKDVRKDVRKDAA